MKNSIKCINMSPQYYILSHKISLTVGNNYEFKNINHRTGKICIKNNYGLYKYYPLSWFEFNIKTERKIKILNLK